MKNNKKRLINAAPYESCRIIANSEDAGVPVKEIKTVDAVFLDDVIGFLGEKIEEYEGCADLAFLNGMREAKQLLVYYKKEA